MFIVHESRRRRACRSAGHICPPRSSPFLGVAASWEGRAVRRSHDDWRTSRVCVGLLNNRRCIAPDNATDGHKKAREKGSVVGQSSATPAVQVGKRCIPKSRPGCAHKLSQCPHYAVGPGAISKNANGSWKRSVRVVERVGMEQNSSRTIDEANDDTNS